MKIFKLFAIILSTAAAILLFTLLFFVVTEFRPEQNIDLAPVHNQTARNSTPGGLRLLSWNMGYCGLGNKMDFFMEGGESTARSPLEDQRKALDAMISFIDGQEPDICLLQEVDTASKRSFRADQLYTVANAFKDYEIYHALNYKSPFIPLPAAEPIGRVESGIALLSRFSIDSAVRRQLPEATLGR